MSRYRNQLEILLTQGKLSREDVMQVLGKLQSPSTEPQQFQDLFESQSYLENLPEMQWVIKELCQDGEVNWLGALPKHGKTWLFLLIVKALLTGENCFGDERFEVRVASKRVIYLIPEVGARSFRIRLRLLGLMGHVFDPVTNPGGRLFLRTLSKGAKLALRDVTLLAGVEDADVFLDTAIRWIEGDENNASDMKILSESIFALITAGARSIWPAHHAPKGFEKEVYMTLQNMFRGSGEFGAGLTNAFGMKKISVNPTTFHFEDIEGRDREETIPNFHLILEPYRDEAGNKRIAAKIINDDAENLSKSQTQKENARKQGKPPDPIKAEKIAYLRTLSGSNAELSRLLAKQFPASSITTPQTIGKWLKEPNPLPMSGDLSHVSEPTEDNVTGCNIKAKDDPNYFVDQIKEQADF